MNRRNDCAEFLARKTYMATRSVLRLSWQRRRMNWDLVVSFYDIECGEDFPESKLMCEVGNLPNWILVGDSPSIQNTIVTAGPPAVFFLWD